MLGGSESHLRQDFAAQNAARRKCAGFGIRGTFNSAQASELLVHQGFRTAKTLVTRHSARFFVSRAAGGLTQG